MSKIPGLIVTGSKGNWKVSQKVDLSELFGKTNLSNSFKERVGQAIIDRMLERIDKEVSVHGKSYPGEAGSYSDEYASSIEFKAAGKTKGDVNLRKRGSLLNLMTIIDNSGDSIEIGWDDQINNAKAHGHMTGFNGKNLDKKREFFGANMKILKEVKSEYIDELKTDTESRDSDNDLSLTALDILKRSQQLEDNTGFDLNFFLGSIDER